MSGDPIGALTASELDQLGKDNGSTGEDVLSFFCTRCKQRPPRGLRVGYRQGVVMVRCNRCNAWIATIAVKPGAA